jgi:hypothetical protein
MQKYGAKWDDDFDELEIEYQCMRWGGRWKNKRTGEECGKGLYFHYKTAMTLMWPEDDWHRWAELGLREMIQNKYTAFLGCASSGKTYGASKFAVIEYALEPEKTLVIVSSTEGRGLELRIWGQIKDLHGRAKKRFDWIPGQIIDYIKCISTDELDKAKGKKEGRNLTRGLICIPSKSGGKTQGMASYVGIKQARIRLICDEVQHMEPGSLEAISNLSSNRDFKVVAMGNPIDPLDPLGTIAEPKGGWSTHPEPTKTTTWDTKWPGGRCVNFVGTDSPNFDYSQNRGLKYPYLIGQQFIDENAQIWTRDSARFFEQCVGVMKSGMLNRRVITKDLCRIHHASEKAIWRNEDRKRICAIDLAYSGVGGDRCVIMWGEFGEAATGEQIIRTSKPEVIPVSISGDKTPEDQIAEFARDYLMGLGIEPDHLFYDSTGRGTMGIAFARVFEYLKKKPVPVEYGGSPSPRPVRYDLFTVEDGVKRHVRCDEFYSDKVSELWMSTRYAIETDQVRELDAEVIEEGCTREYGTEKGKKTFVESKHDPRVREKMKVSPDLYDCWACLLEGARQLGFQIRKVGTTSADLVDEVDEWAEVENEKFAQRLRPYLLQTERMPWAA